MSYKDEQGLFMKLKTLSTTVVLIVVNSATAFSGTMGSAPQKDLLLDYSSYVATLSIGPAWSNSGQTQTFFLQPNIEKTYATNHNTSTIASGEIFLGKQHKLHEHLLGQLGLAVATTSNVNPSGSIWEDADPNFNNYTYDYNVSHTYVAVKGKMLTSAWETVQPYISASLGAGFNNAHAFHITPKIEQEVPAPSFQSNTTTALSYTVGLGLQRAFTTHLSAGIGYEFSDWGKSQLNAATGQSLNKGLLLNHLYTNELQFSLSYTA